MARNYNVVPTELMLRATTSGTVPIQLRAGTSGYDLTAVGTVEVDLKDKSGGTSMFSTDNNLAVVWRTAGSINWVPGTGHLVAGSAPYHGYFKLLRSVTQFDFVPEDSEFTINVREAW